MLRKLLLLGGLYIICCSTVLADDQRVKFTWEPRHTEELRKANVCWDTVESGAPCLSPFQKHTKDTLAAFQIALAFGHLPVGTYRYTKPTNSELEHSLFVEALQAPLEFEFTKEHQTLLRYMTVEASESWQTDGELYGVDAKRPYGDFTYYELEMAKHLGLPTTTNPEGWKEIDKETERRLTALHHQMEAAVQVYLQNFKIEPGTFEGEPDYGIWERVK